MNSTDYGAPRERLLRMGRVERTNSLLKTSYLYAVIAGGFAATVILTPETVDRADHGLLLFAAMAILSEWAHVPLARGAMSLSFSVILPAYVLYGTGGAIACQVVGYLLGDALYDSRGWQVKFFNMGQYTLTLVAADQAFRLAAGRLPLASGVDLLGLLLFTAVYFVVNHVFVGVWFTLTQPEVGHRVIWRDPAKWEGLTYLITGPLGIAVIMLYSVRGLASVATLFAVSLAAAFVFRLTFRLDSLNRELRLLYEGAQKLAQGLELEAVKDHTLELLGKLAPFDMAGVLVWDDVSQVLRCVAALPDGCGLEGKAFRLGEGPISLATEGLAVKVMQLGGAECEGAGLTCVGLTPPRSLLVAPMAFESELVGSLVLASAQRNSYSDEHVRLLTIFAAQAGTALNRAIHYQHTRQLAITDAKTGVYNYRFFYERLVDEIRRHEARQRCFSIIFLDLDYLKDINDRFGHQVGDDVLIQVAAIISGSIRETDEVARYGGEEFVVLLPGTEPSEAMVVAERIRQAVERHEFTSRLGFGPIRVTITAGVSTYPDHATQPDELIFRADEAMYSGKHHGRNRVLLYVPVPGPATSEVGPA